MRPVSARLANLTKDIGLFIDEYSASLSDDQDRAALDKADEMPYPKLLDTVENTYDFRSPTNVVLTDHQPEYRFVHRLFMAKNAKVLRSWIKAPDSGFYEIEYSFQEGGAGRTKRGKFSPDFFLWMKDIDVVVVCEVKADGDDSWRNKGKMSAAHSHFQEVNRLLEQIGSQRRYVAHVVTPRDYDKLFEALRHGEPESFHSGLQGVLDAKP